MNEWRRLAKSLAQDLIVWRFVALLAYIGAFSYMVLSESPSVRSLIGYSLPILLFAVTSLVFTRRDLKRIRNLEDKYKDQIT
jgi:hypothetical protein